MTGAPPAHDALDIIGCAIMAAQLSSPEAISEPIHTAYTTYPAYKLALPIPGLFTFAILAVS